MSTIDGALKSYIKMLDLMPSVSFNEMDDEFSARMRVKRNGKTEIICSYSPQTTAILKFLGASYNKKSRCLEFEKDDSELALRAFDLVSKSTVLRYRLWLIQKGEE